jgi:ATP-dependent Clp protease protease subunit
MKKTWYSIKAAEGDKPVEIFIYDEIGLWGISAESFLREFKALDPKAAINLRINSPGGDVFDGTAISNILQRHEGKITVTVDGIAASMASLIAMAGDEIIMPENAYMMIHNPWSIAIGDAAEMRDMADLLEKLAQTGANTYAKRSGQDVAKILELMSEESWLTAAEAKELGLADQVTPAIKIAARFRLNKFKSLPQALEGIETASSSTAENPETDGTSAPAATATNETTAAGPETDPAQIETDPGKTETETPNAETAAAEARTLAVAIVEACAKAGVPEAAARFIGEGLTLEQVNAKFVGADKIRGLCTAARVPDRAKNYIAMGMSEDEVRKDLWAIMLNRDTADINGTLGPDVERSNSTQKKFATSAEIYARRAQHKSA